MFTSRIKDASVFIYGISRFWWTHSCLELFVSTLEVFVTVDQKRLPLLKILKLWNWITLPGIRHRICNDESSLVRVDHSLLLRDIHSGANGEQNSYPPHIWRTETWLNKQPYWDLPGCNWHYRICSFQVRIQTIQAGYHHPPPNIPRG